jgi:predicted permease
MGMLRRVANLFRRSRVDGEITAELEAHLAMRTEDNLARGMAPEQAQREARLRFGSPTATRERVTAADATLGVDTLARDARYAARQLWRSPGFALTAIFILALGIAANVLVFGVLNAILLRPLDLPGADRLFQVEQKEPGNWSQSYPDYLDFRARNKAFSDLAVYRIGDAALSAGGKAQRCWYNDVSGNYFDMLGVQPALGRFFHSNDEQGANSAPFIVLSDAFWRSRFNADPRIVGMTVDLNKHPFTIIGVAPKSFHGTEIFFWPDFFMPIVNEEQAEGFDFLIQRPNHGSLVIGMLKAGVTPQQAADNLNAVASQLRREHPAEDDGLFVRLVKPGLFGDVLGGPAGPFLAAIMVLSLLVLVAACVNLAGIFAARAADRTRELAICISIGSTRWRLLRRVLMEAVFISIAGGVTGTLIAAALLGALTRWQPIAGFPIHVTVIPDLRVYAIALLLTFASSLLPGLVPARQIWRTDAMQAMKSAVAAGGLLRRFTLRDVLMGIQIAVCALLVTASLVSWRGMERSLHAPLGFIPHGAIVATTEMHMAGYSEKTALPVQRRMIEEASRIPGITAVGTVDEAPLSTGGSNSDVYREDTKTPGASHAVTGAHYFSISPGYLAAAGTRLLAGRGFTWADGPDALKVAIVNQTLARRLFGDSPALGRKFRGGDFKLDVIVGVVEDGKYDSLTEDPKAAMFFPLAQEPAGDTTLVVRSQLPTAEVAPALNRMLRGIDSNLPFSIQAWPDALAIVLFPARVATAALSVMGLLAALLAVTGVFGMAAYSVSKRMRELGIRVAMGAQRRQLIRSALGRPVILLLAGSGLGLAAGAVASRLLSFLVYQATPRDPLVLAGALLAMALIGLVATWIPAARALRVDPAQLLREE